MCLQMFLYLKSSLLKRKKLGTFNNNSVYLFKLIIHGNLGKGINAGFGLGVGTCSTSASSIFLIMTVLINDTVLIIIKGNIK